ncbi:hypothetical protein [uncultured Thiodictyon sp.]|uniref:hypothetical protein n=1 Tax=uncultured Thiodictyon sp. TaxID=1846217 RepID=UPI0025F378F6|nr:hypothetical protein [uncultured Thiodictyon sp.]
MPSLAHPSLPAQAIHAGAVLVASLLATPALAQTTAPDLTPAGLVAFFDQPECPAGWSGYADGFGRLLLGVTNLTEYQLGASVGTALSGANPPTHGHSFSTSVDVGSKGLAGTKGGNDSGAAAGGHPVPGSGSQPVDPAETGWGFIQRTLCRRDPAATLPQWDNLRGNLPAGTIAFFAQATPNVNQPCPSGWASARRPSGYQGSWSGTAGYCITVALDGTDADGDGVLRGRGSNPASIQGNYPNELSDWSMIVWQGGCGPDSGGTQQMTYNWTDQQQRPDFNVNLDLASLAIVVAGNWNTASGIAMGLYTPGTANFNLGSYVPSDISDGVQLQTMTPGVAVVSAGPLDGAGQSVFPVAIAQVPVNGVFPMPFAGTGADSATRGRIVGTSLPNLASAGVHSHTLASGITLSAERFDLVGGDTEHLGTPGWHPFTATASSDDPGVPYLQLLLCRKTAAAAAPPPPGLANLILYADTPCADLSGSAGQTWTAATADSGRFAVGLAPGAAGPGQTFGGPALAPLAQPQHTHAFAGTVGIEGHGVTPAFWFHSTIGDAADNVAFSGTTDPAVAPLPYLAVSACRPCGGVGQPACP